MDEGDPFSVHSGMAIVGFGRSSRHGWSTFMRNRVFGHTILSSANADKMTQKGEYSILMYSATLNQESCSGSHDVDDSVRQLCDCEAIVRENYVLVRVPGVTLILWHRYELVFIVKNQSRPIDS